MEIKDSENEQLKLYENLKDTNTLREVQKYVYNINEIRGFNNQEITKTMLLLTEEIGELAKAIRKNATDLKTDIKKDYNYDTIESEVSDVFYVLCCICNKLNIDIFSSLKEKEKQNTKRIWQ